MAEAEDLDDCATRHAMGVGPRSSWVLAVCREKPPLCPKISRPDPWGRKITLHIIYYLRIHGMVDFFVMVDVLGRFCIFLWYQCGGHNGFPIMGLFFLEFSPVFFWAPEIPPRFSKRKTGGRFGWMNVLGTFPPPPGK